MSVREKIKVDEERIQELVSRGIPPNNGFQPQPHIESSDASSTDESPPQAKVERSKRTLKDRAELYCKRFFTKFEFEKRKMIYVSQETHRRLSNTVQIAGNDRSNLSSYVENIIREHFERNKEIINGVYADNFDPPA